MPRKFFGTDGIRGEANRFLTADLALAAGRAVVAVLPAENPRILIGCDTRISSPMLEAALIAGISSAGGHVARLGIIPTPAVASLVIGQGADAGAVISASHNPYQDNGIKFFGSGGFKLSDGQETEMEQHLARRAGSAAAPAPQGPGIVGDLDRPVETYIDGLLSSFNLDLSGIRLVIDCANGAAFRSSPLAFRQLGADVSVLNDNPDGYNINDGCGSTHIDPLRKTVKADGFDIGLAFDGDGDRVIAVGAGGAVVDGDAIMAICAGHLKEAGDLPQDTVVTTVMTNLGFHIAMKKMGIAVKTTDVGDRYVLEEMLAGGYGFGGEQSGHIINLATGTTGDGLATSLLLLKVMTETGVPLSELAGVMKRLPQKLVNVRVSDTGGLDGAAAVWQKIDEESARLGNDGRILVRPSGTEPVIRVMVEAPTAVLCDEVCDKIAAVVTEAMGTA